MKYDKKFFASLAILILILFTSGCFRVPENHLSLFQRSIVINNKETEKTILSKADITKTNDPKVNNIKTLYLKGSPYEMGFQHGKLLKKDINANFSHIIKVIKFFATEDMMDEIYDIMAPYIPVEEKEEMRGLAHGADMPLKVIHWIHAIPEVSEYGKKKQFRNRFKFLYGSSCSNIVAFGKATSTGEMLQLRVLDWIRFLGAQKYPVIIVRQPDSGNASVSFSFAGFIGCVTGMNEKQMAFGEMGYGSPSNETLEGIPFVFLYRKLMREANTLKEATQMIENAKRTCSYVYMISDAKIPFHTTNALLFVADSEKVEKYPENTYLEDRKKTRKYPAIDDVVYGGPKAEILHEVLTVNYGKITPYVLMDITKKISLDENMQNVVFKPNTLEAWVSNANRKKKEAGKACNQKWFYFNFGEELKKRRSSSLKN